MTEVKMKKSTETLGSLVYTRDSDNQLKKTTSKDLPGTEVTENTTTKTTASRNPAPPNTNTTPPTTPPRRVRSQTPTTKATSSKKAPARRTLTTNSGSAPKPLLKGGATTYGYDQAGNLISVERPEKESVPKIEDSYAYNGEGLRTSQTVSGTTTYMAWDMAEELPLILSDGTNSYIYGPDGLPVEQINNEHRYRSITCTTISKAQHASLLAPLAKTKVPTPTPPTVRCRNTRARPQRRWAMMVSTPAATPG